MNQSNELINEAIKRILLDIVIRGHGDRLIGRWSREPEIQEFLDQVPYMLDRINQLHLACTRSEPLELDHVHHYHHNHSRESLPPGRTSLTDFINLIGHDMHWLVRTRDSLGLSALHKSVLFNNRPIAEYIVDRYQDELAPTSWQTNRASRSKSRSSSEVVKLIDAQDKYGRTALHYAAALVHGERVVSAGESHQFKSRNQLYHFLVSKDANQEVQDFRGKTASYYLLNPHQLHAKSVIHLANKLNASYQANVLSKTLKASRELRPFIDDPNSIIVTTDPNSLIEEEPDANIRLMSKSQTDLRTCLDESGLDSSSKVKSRSINENLHEPNRTGIKNIKVNRKSKFDHKLTAEASTEPDLSSHEGREDSWLTCSVLASESSGSHLDESSADITVDQAYKNLISERVNGHRLDQQTQKKLLKTLNDGDMDKITELIIEGYGNMIVDEASTSCWNLQCKRYVMNVVPTLLSKLDKLHESIAKNQQDTMKNILTEEPILARIRRPYRRASMNALHVAISFERVQMIRYLIDHFPESAIQRDSNGATSLHWAARSLRLERLYCWLLEKFEPQLEQVRDSKGRSAFDYRQQAIRLASYGERHPIQAEKTSDVRDLMRWNAKTASELECRGKRLTLERRKNAKTNQTVEVRPSKDRQNEPILATSELDACQVELLESGQGSGLNSEASNFELHKSNSTTSSQSQLLSPSPDTETSNPMKMEAIIIDALENDKLRSLEHLILAGCGSKILNIYGKLQQDSTLTDAKSRPSPAICDFVKNHLPAFMETIEKAHEAVHQCFAYYEPELVKNSPDGQFLKLCNLMGDKRLIMSRDSHGASPLHIAVMRADNRLVEYLIRRQPEAASAPDLMGRNVLHYGAIACSFYMNHGVLRLTKCRVGSELNQGREASSYWLLDQTVRDIYDKLCARYGELSKLKDKGGLSCSHYLEKGSKIGHIDLSAHLSDSLDPSVIEPCCPEYSQMLSIYGYKIWNKIQEDATSTHDETLAPIDIAPTTMEGIEKLSQESKPVIKDEKEKPESSDVGVKRTRSCSSADSNRRQPKAKDYSSRPQVKTTDDLLDSLKGDLVVPLHSNARFTTSAVRQVAPRPTVGSEAGFPMISRSTNLNETASRIQTAQDLDFKRGAKLESSGKINSPTGQGSEKLLDDISHINHHHSTKRLDIGRNVHLRYRSKAHQSIVGGVIVPSTIHDDESGEIETYDIIYRQPSPLNGHRYTLSGRRDGDQDISNQRNEPSRLGSGKRESSRSDSESSDSVGSDDDDNVDEDYNERVERLSNEFDERVTREKNELKTKVDQIMNEIRSNAKLDRSQKMTGSGNSSGKVAFALHDTSRRHSKEISENLKSEPSPTIRLSSTGDSPVCTSNSSISSFTSNQSHVSPTRRQSPNTSSSQSRSPSSRSSISTSPTSSIAIALAKNTNETQRKPTGTEVHHSSDVTSTDTARTQLTEMNNKLLNGVTTLDTVSKNAFGQTYLHFISSRPQVSSALYKVLEHASHLIGERDAFYRTARDVAVQFNLPSNVMVIDEFIIDAFIGAKTALLRNLLNQGYSPLIHVSDPDGNDIMLILKLLKLDKMISFLLQMADFQRWRDELHTFIRHGYSAGVSELIKKHKDLVRARSMHARTSVHLAVLFERLEMIEELLEMDSTGVHVTDCMGRTPLHYAYGMSRGPNIIKIIQILETHGSDSDARDVKMRTPRYYSIFRAEIEEIKRIELELN